MCGLSRVVSLCGVFLCLTPLGAATWPVERGTSREPAPYRYDAAVWKTVPPDFLDDAPACLLLAATTHLVEADGAVETITHEITRLNSRKSIEKLGEFRGITFTPAYQKVVLNVARLHKPNGTTVEVEPQHVHLRDVSTDFQVYSPDKQLIISFPTLEVGDVLEVKWTQRGKNPEHHGQFFTRYHFGDLDYPVVRDELKVQLPADRPLKSACVNRQLEPALSEAAGQRLYCWSATNCRQLAREEDRPSKEELRPQVVCSTFASWDQVAEWKRKLRADCWDCTPAVKKIVGETTRGLTAPLEKARALSYWVRRNIRYVSAGVRHDYTPHKPHDVLTSRQGDCKDTSQLLAVMLREAGVPCYLVTLGVLDDGNVLEEVPSPWGTHGILLVRIDGVDHWIDTTASLSAWDFLPKSCRDRLCYLTDDKWVILKRTPPLTAAEQSFETTTEVSIGADLSSRLFRRETYSGLAAVHQRDRWLEVPEGERRRTTTAKLLDSHSGARLHRLDIDEAALKDFDRPVQASLEFTIPGQFAGKERDGSFTDSRVWAYLLGYNLDPERQLPLELSSAMESRHCYLFRAPAGYEFDGLPKPRVVRSRWGSFTRQAKWLGDSWRTLQVDFELRLEKTRVEPADFDAFRRFHKEVSEAYRVWVALERSWQRKHAAELEVVTMLAPDDAASAALLTELYLHHGDREEARRVLRRARFYRPEDVALLELAVKAAANAEEAEKAQRELLTRHPDDPTRGIALAALLIERNKQALAAPLLETLTKTAPPAARAQAHYQLARARLADNRPEEALTQLGQSAALEAGKSHLLSVALLRGRTLEKLKRPAEALKAYEVAHRADRQSEEALLLVIETALTCDDRLTAGDHLRRYVELVGRRITGLNRAAELALRLGWQREAFDLAAKAREVGFSEGTQRILGLIHLQRGEIDKALFHLEKADPTAAVLEGLIRAHLALGNMQAAERESRRAGLIPQPPDDLKQTRARTQALTARRDAYLKQAGTKQIAAFDRLVCAEELREQKRTPARIEALLALADDSVGSVRALKGMLSLERGQLREALVHADKAILASPWDARGWYVRGRVRLERLAVGALADLERAARLSQEKDADILLALGQAQTAAGYAEAAQESFRKAAQLRAQP